MNLREEIEKAMYLNIKDVWGNDSDGSRAIEELVELFKSFALECVGDDWIDVPIEGGAYEHNFAMEGARYAKQEIRKRIEEVGK